MMDIGSLIPRGKRRYIIMIFGKGNLNNSHNDYLLSGKYENEREQRGREKKVFRKEMNIALPPSLNVRRFNFLSVANEAAMLHMQNFCTLEHFKSFYMYCFLVLPNLPRISKTFFSALQEKRECLNWFDSNVF